MFKGLIGSILAVIIASHIPNIVFIGVGVLLVCGFVLFKIVDHIDRQEVDKHDQHPMD